MQLTSKNQAPVTSREDYPYTGFPIIDGKMQQTPAQTVHTMISGPSGVGKTRRLLAPAIIAWNGSVLAVSSKTDLIEHCVKPRLARHGRGRTYIIDLSGEIPDNQVPEGAEKVTVDPVALITGNDSALDMADTLMKTGDAGAGSGSGSDGSSFWENITRGILAGILLAAAAQEKDISWVRRAINLVDLPEGIDDEVAHEYPSWSAALMALEEAGEDILADEVKSGMQITDKMRDSMMITMKSAVAPWQRHTVMGSRAERAFHPKMLEHPRATLFMVAPEDGVAAGAAVACVDVISKHWRANQTKSQDERFAPILFAVDELCNTLPWKKLPNVVTESRAMGIRLLVAVQGTSQLAARYGENGMQQLRDTFPTFLLLRGATEQQMIEDAAWWDGEQEKTKVSYDAQGKKSESFEMVPRTAPQSLLPSSVEYARLLRGTVPGRDYTQSGVLVRIPDMSQLKLPGHEKD